MDAVESDFWPVRERRVCGVSGGSWDSREGMARHLQGLAIICRRWCWRPLDKCSLQSFNQQQWWRIVKQSSLGEGRRVTCSAAASPSIPGNGDASFCPFHDGCWANAAFTKAMGKIGRSGGCAAVFEFGGTLQHSVFGGGRGFEVEGFERTKAFPTHQRWVEGVKVEHSEDTNRKVSGFVDNLHTKMHIKRPSLTSSGLLAARQSS